MIAHQLAKLKMTGQTLLAEVASMHAYLTDEGLELSFSKIQKTKLLKAMCAKFPDPSQIIKVAGVKRFVPEKAAYKILRPFYSTLVGISDFHELMLVLLQGCVKEKVDYFSVNVSPDLLEMVYDLVQLGVQLVNLSQGKRCKTVYCLQVYVMSALGKQKTTEELVQPRLLAFLREYLDPVRGLWNTLAPFGEMMVDGLLRLLPTYALIRDANAIPTHFSLMSSSVEITHPPRDTSYHYMMRTERMEGWYALLVYFPKALLERGAIDMLRAVAPDLAFVPVYRDKICVTSRMSDELQTYRVKNMSTGKLRKCAKESAADSARCAEARRRRRLLWGRELLMWYLALSDTPALAGPKLPIVLALLANARAEILWYFRYQTHASKLKVSQAETDDTVVAEMIYYSLSLQRVLREQQKSIVEYYVQYLKKADAGFLRELTEDGEMTRLVGEDLRTVLAWMLRWVNTAEPERDFSKVEQKWAEIQVYLMTFDWRGGDGSASVDERTEYVGKLVSRLQHVMFHVRAVESLENLIDDYASLKELWYFNAKVHECYDRLVRSVSVDAHRHHVMSYLVLLSQAVENGPMLNDAEQQRVRDTARTMAINFMKNICSRVVQLFEYVFVFKCYYEGQVTASTAMLSTSRGAAKAPEATQQVQHPGSECLWHNHSQLSDAENAISLMWTLCWEFEEFRNVLVGNAIITPKAFLAKKIRKVLYRQISEQIYVPGPGHTSQSTAPAGLSKDEPMLRKPSVLLHRVCLLMQEYQQLDYFVNLNVPAIIESVLRAHLLASTPVAPRHRSNKATLALATTKGAPALAEVITTWYVNVFFRRSRRAAPPAAFSRHLPMRRVFSTLPHHALKAERYMESNELTALVKLLGPHGVEHMDGVMLDGIIQEVRVLLDAFMLMKPQLKAIGGPGEQFDSMLLPTLKTLRTGNYMQVFAVAQISIGRALVYRKMLREVLGNVQDEVVPHIHQSLKNACRLTSRDSNVDLSELRALARDTGIDFMAGGDGDQGLTDAIVSSIRPEREHRSTLVLAYAVSLFVSNEWKEANFDVATQSFDNDAHLMARTILYMLWQFPLHQSKWDAQQQFEEQLNLFVDKSMMLLAHFIADCKSEKVVPKGYINILLFLDHLIKLIPATLRCKFRWYLPYALVHSARMTVAKRKRKV